LKRKKVLDDTNGTTPMDYTNLQTARDTLDILAKLFPRLASAEQKRVHLQWLNLCQEIIAQTTKKV
jgi:hypothetical protein